MSDEQHDRTSHATVWTWTISAVGAVLLYVLSAGPVVGYFANGRMSETALRNLKIIYMPLEWLAKTPGVQPLLQQHFDWWREALRNKP